MPVRIVFEAESSDELLELVRRWALGSSASAAAESEEPGLTLEVRAADASTFRALVQGVRGEGSRRLMREVAEASMGGDAVPFDEGLLSRYGRSKPVAFAGIVSGPNRRMQSLAGRYLITRDHDGYRMTRADAAGVLDALAAEDGRARE